MRMRRPATTFMLLSVVLGTALTIGCGRSTTPNASSVGAGSDGTAEAQPAKAFKARLAVMRFQAQSAGIKDKTEQLDAKLAAALADTGKFIVLPEADVRQQQQLLADKLKTTDAIAIASKLAENLSADGVFVPYATFEGDFICLTVKVIDNAAPDQPRNYEIEAKGGLKELYDGVGQLAAKAAADATLFPPVVTLDCGEGVKTGPATVIALPPAHVMVAHAAPQDRALRTELPEGPNVKAARRPHPLWSHSRRSNAELGSRMAQFRELLTARARHRRTMVGPRPYSS